MKKIIGAAAAGLVLTGAAFADASISAQARIYSDVFTYESPSHKSQRTTDGKDNNGYGVDDAGTVTWAKDTTHKDDVTLNASTDNAGAKLVFSVNSNFGKDNTPYNTTDGKANGGTDNDGAVALTSYQLWAKFGKIRIDAGAYDQRLSKNVNNDGNWGSNYSSPNKPGIWIPFGMTSKTWGKDAGNITSLVGAKKTTSFQVSTSLTDQLTLRGVLFLSKNGTIANAGSKDDNDVTDPWIFTPFALGAVYKLDKNSQIAVVGKLNHIAQQTKDKPQESIWTLQADYYNKLNSNLEIEVAYTLGAAIYTNNGHIKRTADGDDWVQINDGEKAQDRDVFAHGLEFHVKDNLSSQLSVTGIVALNYVQSDEATRRTNRGNPTKGGKYEYKDSLAKSYTLYNAKGEKVSGGAAGELAYLVTASVDYTASDTVTYQVQAKLADDNLFSAVECGSGKHVHVDYLSGMTLNIRPAILLNVDKSQFFAGFDFGIK
ncbi:MAG: hypothetical protein J1D88_10185, partial [Treponema sp.]|nr:hypothetical protein [Treponema sp.]